MTGFKKVKLDNVKRKYRNLEYVESKTDLRDYEGKVRWIVVRGLGREAPMSLLQIHFIKYLEKRLNGLKTQNQKRFQETLLISKQVFQ